MQDLFLRDFGDRRKNYVGNFDRAAFGSIDEYSGSV